MEKITPVLAFLIFTSQVIAQNVGINTNDPKATLDLNGNMRMQSTTLTVVANACALPMGKGNVLLTGTSTGPITINGNAVDGTLIIITNQCAHVALLEDRQILPGKKILFAVTNGKYKPVDGEAGWALGGNANTDPATQFIGTSDNSSLGFRTGNVEQMRLTSTGLEMANEIKPNGVGGTQNQVLQNNGNGTMAWANAATATGSSAGFGAWGDCATNANISEYNPVAMDDGNANELSGKSVSVDGDYAIVGAAFDDNKGSASIYHRVAGVWAFQTKLLNTAAAASDNFGISVSIHGDYAIVGCYLDDGVAGLNQGSASIYHRVGDVWNLQAQLLNDAAAAEDFFGISVSIHGDYAIVGASEDDDVGGVNQGSASIYHRIGVVWTFQKKLFNDVAAANDKFGYSVSIHGNYAIVGAIYDDGTAGFDQGSAGIYSLAGSLWTFETKLINSVAAANDWFGGSVSIHGNCVIVGAIYDDAGGADRGSASIYRRVAGVWTFQTKLLNTAAAALDIFGFSVAIHGDYAIVGAYADDDAAGVDQGSVTVYKRLGNSWLKYQYILDPNGDSDDYFGGAVSIDAANKRFLIGAQGYNNFMGKAVFGKIN